MTKDKISKRKHNGNHPGEGWERVGITDTIYGTDWAVWKFAVPSGQWTNIKIVANNPVQVKANYRTAWNGSRFADSRDMRLVREFRKDLENLVEEVMREGE